MIIEQPLSKQLWKDCGKNLLISCGVFVLFFALLYIAEMCIPLLQGKLLQFSSLAYCVGIPASVIGVGHILTIRDPKNYVGFIPGIVMEILQTWQFYLLGIYDLMCFYILVFIPFQVASLARWKKQHEGTESVPVWMTTKETLIAILVLALIVMADYLLLTFVVNENSLTDDIALKVFSGLMMGAAILANYGLLFHKKDAWIYWIINSIAGLALYVIEEQIFNVVLYLFFLVINVMALISWVKIRKK